MSLSTAITSYDVAALFGTDYQARSISGWVTTNIQNDTLIDEAAGLIRLGNDNLSIGTDGAGSVTLWTPGDDGNPVSWQYYFHFAYYPLGGDGGRKVRRFGPYTITGTSKTVTNKALTSNVATLTTSEPHGLDVGNTVTVAGVHATFNGTFTITAVGSATTFSYDKTAANVASAAATGTVTSPNVKLTSLEEEQGVPAEYLTQVTETLQEYVVEAEDARDLAQQYRDDAHDISGITISDDVMTVVDADDGSDFRVQQDARLVASIEGKVGDDLDDDESTVGGKLGEALERHTSPAFIAAENRAVKDVLVVDPYYGSFTQGATGLEVQGAIDGAMDAAAQQGGGNVLLPSTPPNGVVDKWEYRADRIVVMPGAWLIGNNWSNYGDRGSRIRQHSGINDDFVVFHDAGSLLARPFLGPAGVKDLVLLGNIAATAGHAIAVRCQDGREAQMQDMFTLERLVVSYFAESGIWASGGSPVRARSVVGFWNKGFTIELEDLGVDADNHDIHHVSLEDVSGDGNMGYEADGYGAAVLLKGHRDSFGATLRDVKSEYRILPTYAGGDDTTMGNFHAVILEDCDSDISLDGITIIANGTQDRRPGPPVLVTGTTRRPNLTWRGVGIRGHHSTQTDDPEIYARVRDESQGVTIDHTTGHGVLGPAADAAAVPDHAAGQSPMLRESVNAGLGSWSTVTNRMRLTYWTAARTEEITTVDTAVTSAAVGTTESRIGLFTVASDGALTLVASTANDTALWATTGKRTKALQAAYILKQHQRYTWGLYWAGTTTAPGIAGQTILVANEMMSTAPRQAGLVNGLSGLPSSVAAVDVGDGNHRHYVYGH